MYKYCYSNKAPADVYPSLCFQRQEKNGSLDLGWVEKYAEFSHWRIKFFIGG